MSQEEQRLAVYRKLMYQRPGEKNSIPEDACCRGCRNHRPEWKYRYCVLIECPYIKGMTTFREIYRKGE